MNKVIAIILSSFLLVGCTMFNTTTDEVSEEAAGKIYNDGLILVENGDFGAAAKKFDEVDRQHPYSHWAKKAMVMSTFTHHRSGDYTSAAETGERFVRLHPTDEEAPYVAFLMAQSFEAMIPEVSRDQQNSAKAIESYEYIMRTYPESKYAREAAKRIEFAKDQLAGKEMSVGRFYLGKRNYLAAVNRFKYVVTNFEQTRHVEEALYRLTEAYLALGLVDEAQGAGAVLGHNFPESEWYKRAYALLKGKGYSPEKSVTGWLSGLF